ncbi:MAG TPA: hypothetical protein VHW02_14405 [Rhizomicrobium sp.]|nr:hypothetical protein [Rhizomicrobium sp.]
MSWLLGVFDAVLPGTGLFILFDTLLLWGAMAGLLLLQPRPSWIAVVAAVLCAALPQFLIYPGIVWKDVLFANAALAGFVCLAHAATSWDRVRFRFAMIAAALALLVLATLTRQNGVVVLIAEAMAVGTIAAMNAPAHRVARAFALGTGAFAAAAILAGTITLALSLRVTNAAGPSSEIRLLQDYDIIGMAKANAAAKLDVLRKKSPALQQAILSDGIRLYTPRYNDTLMQSPALQAALANTAVQVTSEQWLTLIAQHPWTYLSMRARVFDWVLLTPDIRSCHPYFVGIDGPAAQMNQLHLRARQDSRDVFLNGYAAAFAGTPIFSHLTFIVLGAAALFVLIRRRRPADIAMAFLLAGTAAFALSFFIISIACDYRYLYCLDVSALAAAFYISLGGFERLSRAAKAI